MLFDGLKLKAHQRVIDASGYALTVFGSAAATVLLWQAVSAGEPLRFRFGYPEVTLGCRRRSQ
jgi:hypothetical protein